MKKALVLAAVLACVAYANANIEIFFTNSAAGYGLTNSALAFTPALGTDQDPVTPGIQAADGASYAVGAFPPAGAAATPTINWQLGEFAYIWVRFNNQPLQQKIQGIRISQAAAQDVAYYVQNDLAGDAGFKRWDGDYTLPGAPEFKQKVGQVLAGVTAAGLKNSSNTSMDWNLYDRVTRTYLLGAVKYNQSGTFSADIPNDYNGINVGGTVYVERAIGSANWIPEPASLALLGLAGLLIRRR